MYSPGGLTLMIADPFASPQSAFSVVNVAVKPPPVCPTVTEPVVEHDVPVMVTVTVYVPDPTFVICIPVEPLDHRYVYAPAGVTFTTADPLFNPHPAGVELKVRLNEGGNCSIVVLTIFKHDVPAIETVTVYDPAGTPDNWLPVCPFDHV